MDEVRQDFLAGSRRAIDKHGNIGPREAIGQRDDRQRRRVGCNRPLAGIGHGDQRGEAALGDRIAVGQLSTGAGQFDRGRVAACQRDGARIATGRKIAFVRQRDRPLHEQRGCDPRHPGIDRAVRTRKIRAL